MPQDAVIPADSKIYEGPLVDAVKRFQERHGLTPNGYLRMATPIREDTLQQAVTGGPFGRDGQMLLGGLRPAAEFRLGEMTLVDTIKMRQDLWDKCCPWTEGLARLFDAGQEELFLQDNALPQEGRRAESEFLSLSEFEKVAHKHLVDMRQGRTSSRNLGRDAWLSLLRELDEQGLSLDVGLEGRARLVLDAIRKDGHQVDTWEQCYNAAKRAGYQLGKICRKPAARRGL